VEHLEEDGARLGRLQFRLETLLDNGVAAFQQGTKTLGDNDDFMTNSATKSEVPSRSRYTCTSGKHISPHDRRRPPGPWVVSDDDCPTPPPTPVPPDNIE
jgi:hypothetical protein